MHTYRELILGAYLCFSRFKARYERGAADKTPDWSIFDDQDNLVGIVDLATLHIDKTTEDTIYKQQWGIYDDDGNLVGYVDKTIESGSMASYHRDDNRDNIQRLQQSILCKVEKYEDIAAKLAIWYVVAIFGDFPLALQFYEDVSPLIHDESTGVFATHPGVSGLLIFVESLGHYCFTYANNPNAERTIEISPWELWAPEAMRIERG
jgi:hypothetical protein